MQLYLPDLTVGGFTNRTGHCLCLQAPRPNSLPPYLQRTAMATRYQHNLSLSPQAPKPINLLPYLKRVPAKRVIHLHNLTDDALAFRLAYNDSTPHGLPPGATKADISAYKVRLDTQITNIKTPAAVCPGAF